MSEDKIAQLIEVRAAYVSQMQRAYHTSTRGIATPEQRREWEAGFDRWLAAHEAEVAERAWDEGYEAATEDIGDDAFRTTPNPYRSEADRG